MNPKELFLAQLKPAIVRQLKADISEGKLDMSEKYDLDANFNRVYDAFKSNWSTSTALEALQVSKEDLKRLIKDCLAEVEVQL